MSRRRRLSGSGRSVRLRGVQGEPTRARHVFDSFLLLASCVVAGGMASAEPAPLPATPPDPPAIRALPGYHAERIETRSFPGETYLYEVGPAEASAHLPVVLIHGISRDGAHDWDALVPVLAKQRRVIVLDLPGFGRSTRRPAPWGPVSYANLIEEIVQQRVQGRFDMVAHSLGVSVALEVARRDPERVGTLVLADGAALLHGHAISVEQVERGEASLGILGRSFDFFSNSAYDMMGALSDDMVHRISVSMAGMVGAEGDAAPRAAAALMAHDAGAALDAVRSPTLILWGEGDRVASLRGAWALAARIDGARLEILPGAAHVPMRERPDLFNDRVSRWLSGDRQIGIAPAPPDGSATRDGSCTGERERVVFRGAYRKITLDRCGDVLFDGVRAREIEMSSSTAVGFDTVIEGDQVGLMMWHSRFQLSGGSISADVPVRNRESELNFAGVTLRGAQVVYEAIGRGRAKILCSLCRLEAGGRSDRLHGFRVLRAGETLSPPLPPH